MQTPLVRHEISERVATITLDSPRNRNSLSSALVSQLVAALELCAADDSLMATVLRSSAGAFCSGVDLREALDGDVSELARSIVAIQHGMLTHPVPIIVRLDGPAAGAGLAPVACADIVIARDDVKIAIAAARLGLAAAMISVPLTHRLTPRALADWMLTGRTVNAEEARQAGLITRVVSADEVDDTVGEVLADLRKATHEGLLDAKRMLNAAMVRELTEHGDELAARTAEAFSSELAQTKIKQLLHRW